MSVSKLWRIMLLGLGITSLVSNISAQSQLNHSIEQATFLYEQGRLLEVMSILSSVLTEDSLASYRKNAPKSINSYRKLIIKGYGLETLAHLHMDDEPAAQASFLRLLAYDPAFKSGTGDEKLLHLSKRFRTHPFFTFSLYQGIAFSNIIPNKNGIEYSLMNNKDLEYIGSYSPFTQIGISRYLSKNFNLTLIVSYADRSYTEYSNEPISYNLSETQKWVGLGFESSYNFWQKEGYVSYIFMGTSSQFLIKSEVEVYYDKIYNFNNYRNQFNQSIYGGAGIKLEVGRHLLDVSVFYCRMLYNLTNPRKRYSYDTSLLWGVGYVTNDFTFYDVGIRLAYHYAIYKPIQKKRP